MRARRPVARMESMVLASVPSKSKKTAGAAEKAEGSASGAKGMGGTPFNLHQA